VTKLAAELLCHLYHVNFGVPAVSLRYFTVYGPRQRPDMAFHRFLKAAAAGAPITLFGDGEQTRDFTFVGDAVAATIAAADRGRPGGVYNIGGGSRVSMLQVLDIIARCTGRRLDVRREPSQKGDMRDTYADTSRARADLGSPRRYPSTRAFPRNIAGCHPPGSSMRTRIRLSPSLRTAFAASVCAAMCLLLGAACGSDPKRPVTGAAEADKFLYEQGNTALQDKKWLKSREYFREIVDNYPQSSYRADGQTGHR